MKRLNYFEVHKNKKSKKITYRISSEAMRNAIFMLNEFFKKHNN